MSYHVKTITNIIHKNIDREPETFKQAGAWGHGSAQYGDRLRAVVRYCVHKWPGDLVEIGAMAGGMTTVLAEIAADKQVIAIDPWETGTQNCEGWELQAYLKNTAPYDNITTLRMRSQDKRAFIYLAGRELCFASVDGLHEYDACASDLRLVAAAPIICVDDIGWNPDVRRAFAEFADETGRLVVTHPLCKEGYLVG